MNKEELRALYKQIRLRMTASEVSSNSRMIGRKLLNDTDWEKFQTICVYQPIPRLNEVDVGGVISRLKAQDKEVYILSQDKAAEIPSQKFELIIVPCLAFDKDNFRLGWGGGFYDKFLAAQPQAEKIGVSFQNGFAQSSLPHEPHDIPLNKVITEI